jgi:hypothetical protein
MKTPILILVFAIVFISPGKAQADKSDMRNTFRFGFKGGANYSNVYDMQGQTFQSNPKLGYVIGTFLSIPINKYFGIQPEMLVSQKGFKSSGILVGGNYGLTRTTNYIDFPLLLAIKPSSLLTFLAGPEYSFLFRQTDVYSTGTSATIQDQYFSNENVRKNTLGILGGIDFNVQHFVIGFRAGWDFRNNRDDGLSTDLRYRNVWYQATFAVRF